MTIFFRSFLSLFLVSIFLSFFITNNSLAVGYQLDVFATRAGYSTIGNTASLENMAQLIINVVLSIVGILFLFLTLYAGIKWMSARGIEENITKAKETLQAAVIGLVVISISYAVSNLVFSSLPTTTDNSLQTPTTQLSCFDTVNQCGGACVKKCEVGQKCATVSDCTSGNCKDQVCEIAVDCSNFKNLIDCTADCSWDGNACIPKVVTGLTGKSCTSDQDCAIGETCGVLNICAKKSCTDEEHACGGSCKKCPTEPLNFYSCDINSDCQSGYCEFNTHMCSVASNQIKCLNNPLNLWWGDATTGKCLTKQDEADCQAEQNNCDTNNQKLLGLFQQQHDLCVNNQNIAKSSCVDTCNERVSGCKADCVFEDSLRINDPKACQHVKDAECMVACPGSSAEAYYCALNCMKAATAKCSGDLFTSSKDTLAVCESSCELTAPECITSKCGVTIENLYKCSDIPHTLDACKAINTTPKCQTCESKKDACMEETPALLVL
ncbi:MAG: pilin [Candidatus Magasanikbacteria bacterium]